MTPERSVTIVGGYEPAFGEPPADVAEAGLTATVATVLSTYRSDNPDSVRDHALWVACIRAISEVVAADEAEVYGESWSRLLSRLFRRPVPPPLGTLAAYAIQLSANPDPPTWKLIRWRRDGALVAAAVCESWDLVGGPELYHDSYTTCVFVTSSIAGALVERIRLRVEEEGGHVDAVVDRTTRGPERSGT